MVFKFIKSVKFAIKGLIAVWKGENSFKLQIFSAIAALMWAYVFNFNLAEFSLIIFAIALVLSGEIINTIVEDILDKLYPDFDPIVGKLKDMTAGVVLVYSMAALTIGILVTVSHFM